MTKQNKIFFGVAVGVVVLIFFVRFFLGLSTTATYSGDNGLMKQEVADYAVVGRGMAVTGAPAPSMVNDQAKMMPPVVQSGGSVTQNVERLIIKTGELSLVVKDVKASVGKIAEYAVKNKGFVVSSNISKPDIAPYATIVIRIPVSVFDSGVTDVKALGEVESESINGSDVTEEYVDLGARLKNLQATEQQFMVIMRQAVKISDILEVQRQLSQVRGEIESMQGRMKYLKDSAAFSTLTVNLSTDPSVLPVLEKDKNSWKPWADVKEAARALGEDFKYIAQIVIWFVVYIPLWILIVAVLWVVQKVARKVYNKYIVSNNNKV